MAIVPPNEHISKLIEAFGIDPNNCVSFTLKIKVGEIVSVEVETLLPEEDMKQGAKELETVMKKYELVEKKK